MGVVELARAHLRQRRALMGRTSREVRRLWAGVDRTDIARSWAASVPMAQEVVERAQARAADTADTYLDALMDAHQLPADDEGRVRTAAFVGTASDGRGLNTLLYQPAVTALVALQRRESVSRAMAHGAFTAELITATQVADAGRVADEVATVARPRLAGYVRMLKPPSCARCVILAGKWYAWNNPFKRHPACDCIMVAAPEDTADDIRTNPKAYFESLTEAEQDKIFTKAGAEAVRLGADLNQVVNSRRGARGLTPAGARITRAEVTILRDGRARGRLTPVDAFGVQTFVTHEGTTTRGVAGRSLGAREGGLKLPNARYRSARAPRLMPESIIQIAGDDRAEAIRLLKRNGYLT